jgi:hypothetical protein
MANANETSPAPFLDPCLQCRKNCGDSYWRIARVRGHFCSKSCCEQFKATNEIPKPPARRCWVCNAECPGKAWRLRSFRGSTFCTKECAAKYAKLTLPGQA